MEDTVHESVHSSCVVPIYGLPEEQENVCVYSCDRSLDPWILVQREVSLDSRKSLANPCKGFQ